MMSGISFAEADANRWRDVGIAILGPFPPHPGGVSVQCAILADALENAGARVTRINADIPGLRQRGVVGKGLLPAAQVLHIAHTLRRTRGQWDVLHVHAASWWGFMPAAAGLLARRWGKRLVVTYHGGEAAQFMAKHGGFARSVLQRYHAFLTLTPTQAAIFRHDALAPEIVPNIVPVQDYYFRPRGQLQPHLLWLRQMASRYRPQDALAVFARIRQAYPHATLNMVGDGPLLADMQARARKLGLTGVHFSGALSSEDIPAAYDNADIFLNTSAVDNLPLTLIEASASGLPIVSTSAGAIPDLICADKNGLLAPVGDVDALATHSLRLLADPDLAQRLSLAARDNASQYDWLHVSPLLLRAYDLIP